VIALDGAVVENENFGNILLDIALLRSLRIHVLLVHGAGHQIRRLSQQTGTPASNYDGTGITDAATLQLALDAANRVTHEILEGCRPTTFAAPTATLWWRIPPAFCKELISFIRARSTASTRNSFKPCSSTTWCP
jgi:Acetylglutamate kinase